MRPSLTPPSPTSETLPARPGRRVGAGARERATTPFTLPEAPARPAAQAPEPPPARRSGAADAAADRRATSARPNEDRRTTGAGTRERPDPAGKSDNRRADDRKAHGSEGRDETSSTDDAAAEQSDVDPAAGSDGAPDAAVVTQADSLPVDPDGQNSSDEGDGDTEDSDEKSDTAEADGTAETAAAAALAALVPGAAPAAAKPEGATDAAPAAAPVGSVAAAPPKELPAAMALPGDGALPAPGEPKIGTADAAVKDGAALEPRASKPEPGRREAAADHEKPAHRHLDLPMQAAELKADAASAGPVPAAASAAQAGGTGQAGQAGQAAQTNPAAQAQAVPVLNQVPLGAVPIEIGLKSLSGMNRFEIRLDPAELGRIDVRLDIGDGGDVKAHLVVDRVETLALLQRDAKTLERAFEQAGLKPSEGSIDLSLRDPGSDRRGSDQGSPEQGRRGPAKGDDAPAVERAEAIQQPRRMMWRGAAGVDLRI